jgi:predicted NUDIX family phosphoesterase
MFDRASKKLGLEQAVLGTRNFTEGEFDDVERKGPKIDAKEMEQLLREGAYAVLLEDDAEIMKEFYEQDIDNLLKQRSHVLVTEDGSRQTESWLNKRKKLGKTSKHMFTGDSAKEHAEIDVNDPDFWKKVLPDLVTPDLMLERLQDESLTDEEDVNRDAIAKYMKDLAQMMEGMLDLSRRNTLPERERAVCLKLLLRITLKDDVFDEYEILQAQEWLSVIEGARSRRGRTDLYTAPDHRKSASKSSSSSKSGRGHGSKGPSSGRNAPRLDDNRPSPVHHNELESERKSSRKTKGKSNARRWGNRFGSGTRNLEDIDLEEGHPDDDDEAVGDGNDSDDEYGDGDATVKKTSSKSSSSKLKGKASSSAVKSKAKTEPSSTANKNRNAKRRRSGQDDDDGDDDDADDDEDDDGGEEMTPAVVKKKQAKRSHKKVVFKKSTVGNDKDYADDDRLGVEAGEMEEVDGAGRGVKMMSKKRSRKPSVAKRLYSRDDVNDHDNGHDDNDEGDRDDKDDGDHDDPVAKGASRKSRSRASFLAPVSDRLLQSPLYATS